MQVWSLAPVDVSLSHRLSLPLSPSPFHSLFKNQQKKHPKVRITKTPPRRQTRAWNSTKGCPHRPAGGCHLPKHKRARLVKRRPAHSVSLGSGLAGPGGCGRGLLGTRALNPGFRDFPRDVPATVLATAGTELRVLRFPSSLFVKCIIDFSDGYARHMRTFSVPPGRAYSGTSSF